MKERVLNELRIFYKEFSFIPLIYISSFIFMYLFFFFVGLFNVLPNETNLVHWDAGFYCSIKDYGYQYFWYGPANSAFFPLFSYMWRWLHVGAIGISVFNLGVLIVSLYMLQRTFRIRSLYTFCFLSLPTSIFFFLPYTEALFFFFCALLLCGLKKDNMKMILVGLFFSSLTRATAMFFIPAIICMELFNGGRPLSWPAIKNILCYTAATLAGLFTVVLIQYYQTYEWFAFAKQQMKFWHHTFSWPHYPFETHGGDKILWLDGIAFFFGIFSALLLIVFFVKFCVKSPHILLKNRTFWFSAMYLVMVTTYCLFFNPESDSGTVDLISINRYLMSSAFFLLFIDTALSTFSLNSKNTLIYFSLALLVWISLGLGRPLYFLTDMFQSTHKTTIFFLFLTCYVFGFYYLLHKRLGPYIGGALYVFNLVLAVYVFNQFITNKWVA